MMQIGIHLALASRDVLQYRVVFDLVITAGLNLRRETIEGVLEGLLRGRVGHLRLIKS